MFAPELLDKAEKFLAHCRQNNWQVATAESCTGGLIAGLLTSVAGSSDVVDRGFVTYTNEAKQQMLGVPANLFDEVGAVSEQVARAMAEGAIKNSNANISVSVTGIAGPGGATPEKPVGLVHMAVARRDLPTRHERFVFEGDRAAVRLATVEAALKTMGES